MKNKIITTSIREVKKSLPRFISLLIMSMLGVFVFVGLQSTSPDMLNSLDTLYDEYNIYDIKLQSTLGLNDNDIKEFSKASGVDYIEKSKSIPAIYNNKDNEYVIEINSLPALINKIDLKEGRLPENNNEIVVEDNFLSANSLAINDKITIDSDKLHENILTITGVIYSPLYLNSTGVGYNRGKTNVGSGKIHFYSYMVDDAFNFDYYTSIYITSNSLKKLETSSASYLAELDKLKISLEDIKDVRENNRIDEVVDSIIEEKRTEIEADYNSVVEKLNSNEEVLDKMLKDNSPDGIELEKNNLSTYVSLIDNYLSELDESSSEYKDYLEKKELLVTAINKYNEIDENRNLALDTYNSALKSLEDAKIEEKSKLKSKYHIYDRTDYSVYQEYINDTESISNLSKIFPIVFYLVAILISLVSMSRMVEDDRIGLGTLKSLGFSNYQILFKYIFFSLLATLIGGIIGALLGTYIIPSLIFSIYGILFYLPIFNFCFNTKSILFGFLLTILCIVGATIYTALKVLKEKPSELLRPKAPKNGKRILLERIKFIWNRMSFSKKITTRNLFRYKRRCLVTIFGIAGGAMLMLAGFGIRDSIIDLPKMQYEEIFKSDAIAYSSNEDINDLKEALANPKITEFYSIEQINVTMDKHEGFILVLPKDDNLDKLLTLRTKDTKEEVKLDSNTCFISDKLAQVLKLKVNDKIKAIDSDGIEFEFVISKIVENYISHYIYISEECYKNLGYQFKPNMTFFNTIQLNDQEKLELSTDLLETNRILNVIYSNELIKSASDMLGSLNKVVLILIILSCLLSFVVLYNLSNINMHERKREIATLKVLGFYDKEVDRYITSENIILTVIGIVLGLILGYFLAILVSKTVEIDRVRFIYGVKPLSFLYTTLLSILFTLIINFIAHFSLRKIDMIDSLKSVE